MDCWQLNSCEIYISSSVFNTKSMLQVCDFVAHALAKFLLNQRNVLSNFNHTPASLALISTYSGYTSSTPSVFNKIWMLQSCDFVNFMHKWWLFLFLVDLSLRATAGFVQVARNEHTGTPSFRLHRPGHTMNLTSVQGSRLADIAPVDPMRGPGLQLSPCVQRGIKLC